ncbi:N-acetylmuramoyl-L-alanine amidase [Rhodococcus sp. G-MC3]|uniref:N-acetylmuramoyl-L-alanine amidase n=1 Tax=Rhodococcus sp. G-MC3 TaxID=3046209 RepID=UPI0024B9BFB7|nr:N-acetylmuramoyl-L-alanine amidase [Rhodococcus sp. G-MC3]MDJ0392040.1 N-acetylmuramoyl-L-alanine amidase [Rhodococcus sp. G-MC3]
MERSAVLAMVSAGVLALSVTIPATVLAAPAADQAPGSELAGKTVFLDPGHQGTGHSEDLSKQVDDGRGGTKDCQTTGMTTIDGVGEHTINWNVSQLVKSSLESLGATVVTSRADDSGWGGCVDDRARAATRSGADVAVSIHADSTTTGTDNDKHGFHLIVPTLPILDAAAQSAQSEGGRAASNLMRDSYERAGFTAANYAGVDDGVQERADIAGPALTGVPLVFVEMGNGSNPGDASVLESSEGQLKHAIAISTGVIDYLLGPDTTVEASGGDAQSDVSAPTPSTAAPSSPAAAGGSPASGGSALARLLSGISPYVDSMGVDGLSDLVTEDNVDAVSNFAQGLLKQLMAG